MARRRMVNPSFFEDDQVGRLKLPERLLLLAAWTNADDEGRLRAHPGHLRGLAFTYDDETLDDIVSYRDNIVESLSPANLYAFVVYTDDKGSEYMAFIHWRKTNKPGHPKASDIPAPPEINEVDSKDDGELHETFPNNSGNSHETFPNNSGEFPEDGTRRSGEGRGGEVRSGQDRLGKVRLDGGKEVATSLPLGFREDMKKYLPDDWTDSDDLIDSDFLEFSAAAAAGDRVSAAASHALNWWINHISQVNGKKGKGGGGAVIEGVMQACREYPPPMVGAALLKGAKYKAGKSQSWPYVKKIIREMNGELDASSQQN